MSATDEWLASLREKSAGRVGTALSYDKVSPDKAAEADQLGRSLGVPASVVSSQPELFKRRHEQKKFSDALKDSPATAKWLSELQNGSLAKDDLENLTWFEKNLKPFADTGGPDGPFGFVSGLGRGAARGGKRAASIPSSLRAQKAGSLVADYGKSLDELIAEELAQVGGDNAPASMRVPAMQAAQIRFDAVKDMTEDDRSQVLQQGADELLKAREMLDKAASVEMSAGASKFRDTTLANSENSVMGVLMAFADDPDGGAAFLAETASEFLPMLAAATGVTIATRSPGAGAVAMGLGSGLTENATSAMDFLAEQGVDLSTPDAAADVLANAELMQAARDRGLTRGLIIGLMDAVSGGIAGQKLMASPAGDMVAQGLAQVGFGAGGELTAQLATGDEVDWRDVVVEGLAELVTAPIEVLGVGGRGSVRRLISGANETTLPDVLDQVDQMAAASKLKERSPDKFAEAVERQGLGEVYVPADKLREFFQAKDMTGEEWGLDPEYLNEQALGGVSVPLPMSTYASKITGTDGAAWVRENAVFDPDEMSLSEAALANEQVREVMEEAYQEATDAINEDRALRAADVQIYDSVFSELRAAGRSPDVANYEARVMSSFWRTMGERYGEDPLELAKSMGLRIQGPQTPDVARRRGDLDIRLNALRADEKKALKPYGESLIDFIVSEGGIQDVGGDVASFEPPKGVVAETREEIMDRRSQPTIGAMPALGKGIGLDEMARLANEAGYLDTEDTNDLLAAIGASLAGEPVYRIGEGVDPAMEALAEELSRRAIDLTEMTNDEVAAALEESDGRAFEQAAPEGSDAFREWFGDSKVVDENGDPLVVYHGTATDFEAFSSDAEATHISMPGFYFTPDAAIADNFSASASRKEIRDADGYIEGFEGARTIPAYLSIKNPADIDASEPDGGMASSTRIRAEIEAAQQSGHDGAIIRGWRDGSGDVQYVAFSPEQIKSVHNRGTFDPNDPRILYQNARGSIVFPSGGLQSGETVINLFESANLSTFLHESSHYFLEAFTALADSENAPAQMKADMATIREWLGNDGGAFTTEQHEQWARGGEAYFMEGKAPSLDLADAFARFKSWLTRIYQTARGLNVKVTPEIREVFDRMIATDAEIAEARAEQEMRPLFTEAPAGMPKGDFQTYQRMAQRSAEQAERRLIEKATAKVRREREAWYKAEKKAVRKEVEASTNKLREYRLTEALSNRRWIGEDGETVEQPDMRIDRQALVDMFGDGVLKEISKSRFGGKYAIYKKDGESPAEIAQYFGFKSASEMVDVLQNAERRKSAIDAEVERVMTERHGDPLNDGTIEEEALRAIHNEQQANTVVAEVRHLSGQLGRKTGGLSARVYRQRARAMLGRMTVKDAARSHVFLSAERRAANTAQKAFAKIARGGGETALAEALQAKEQQLLNHMLYNEAKDFEARLQRGREKARGYDKKTVREKLAGGYIEQIDELLARFDFRKRSPGQVARSESLEQYVARMEAEGREAELAVDQRLVDESRKVHYTRLSVDEFNGLMDTIANIDHMGRFKQELIERDRKRKLAESVAGVSEAVRKSQKASDRRDSSAALKALNLIRRPDTILVDLDNGEEMGVVYEELKLGIDKGQALEQQAQVKMAKDFDDLFSGHYTRPELRKMVEPKAVSGVTNRDWSKQEILALALNMGAAENHQRVFDTNVDPEMRMDPETLHNLLSTLDENDWRFVQGMWDMVNSYWPDLAAAHKRKTGVEPDKVQPQLMYDGAPDFVRGGYYPIKYDATRGKSAAADEKSAWDKFLTAGHGSTAAVKNGMTKQRQKSGGGRTIKYDLSVPFQHLRETVRYIALSEAVDNAYRILNHEDVVQAFQDTGNKDTHDTLNLWIKDTAQGPIYNTDFLNSVSRAVKNNFTLSKLAMNMKTVILQATGIGQSAATIGKKNMIRGFAQYMRRPHELISEVTQKSSFMAERQTTFQKDIYDFANDVKIQSPLAGRWSRSKQGIAKVGFWPMIKMQFLVVDVPTWLGAYEAGLRKYKDDDRAVLYADRMVARAQDSGMFGDRAGAERGTVSDNVRQADFVRLFTTLGGYMLTKLNRLNITAKQARLGISEASTATEKSAVALSAATDMFLLLAFEPIFMALIYSYLTDDEDEEDVAKFLAAEMGMALVGGVPVLRDAASAVRGFGGGGVYGSVLESPFRFGQQAMQGEIDTPLLKATGDLVGISTGLPSTAFVRGMSLFLDDDTPLSEVFMGHNPLSE